MQYRGRFAPSPTGPLHAGSLVAALASWLDARAHNGQWLVRIEDVDTPRTVPGATDTILRQLAACGLHSDEPVLAQSTRSTRYQQVLDDLVQRDMAYPCCCSRKEIAEALQRQGHTRARHAETVYPGTCRHGLPPGKTPANTPVAWRLRTEACMENWPPALADTAQQAPEFIATSTARWHDRRLGMQQQDVVAEVGDFVLKRADGCFTYQLAVVVDDADFGITHVVRGEDLADNTARQIVLQHALGLPTPTYLHTPLVLGANGEKLSKQNGALAVEVESPQEALTALVHAAQVLNLVSGVTHTSPTEALATWVQAWRARWSPGSTAPHGTVRRKLS